MTEEIKTDRSNDTRIMRMAVEVAGDDKFVKCGCSDKKI